MVFQVESKTRQWIGLIIIGLVFTAMIFTKLIPQTTYLPYIEPIFGALIYHIIRMLNTNNVVEIHKPYPVSLGVPEVKPTQAQEG